MSDDRPAAPVAPPLAALRARFERAAAAVGARLAPSAFEALAARYAEPQRHYHTLEHVAACLRGLDAHAALAEAPAEVELALWFHDAVYDPRAADNEALSARLARTVLGGAGADPAAVERIARHVEATASHAPGAGDTALVVDLDLSILGAPPPAFGAFERAIRREYAHVPDEAFALGRARVLGRFADAPALYQLAPLRTALEAQARENLRRRLDELAAGRVG